MGSQQLYSLSWGEFGSSLLSTVQVLRTHNEMVDVTLAAGGKIFPAHKLVLSAASPLLMELLKSTHCQHPVLMLAGITASDLEALLQFMYQGEVSVNPTQLPSLLQAAHCLDIQALSPQTLTDQNTMTPISVPIVMADNIQETTSATSVPGDVNLTSLSPSSVLPVRKRKHKQRKNSESDNGKWTTTGVTGGGMAKILKKDRVSEGQMEVALDNTEEANCNGETAVKKLVSDMPVACTVCGVVLRQSRNLRRHMELIHLKAENNGIKPQKRRHPLKEEMKKVEDCAQNVQTMTEIEPLREDGVEQPAGPSRFTILQSLAPRIASPPVYHSSIQGDSYSHTNTMQFGQDLYRHHHSELTLGTGLYTDTREHCSAD